jgi:hypothetical protein
MGAGSSEQRGGGSVIPERASAPEPDCDKENGCPCQRASRSDDELHHLIVFSPDHVRHLATNEMEDNAGPQTLPAAKTTDAGMINSS